MHARVLPRSSTHSVDLEKELETLREENANLRETLQDSESRLDRLQDGVVKLQEEYRSESEELQERVEEMTALIEEDEGEKVELRIDLEKMTRAKKVWLLVAKSILLCTPDLYAFCRDSRITSRLSLRRTNSRHSRVGAAQRRTNVEG